MSKLKCEERSCKHNCHLSCNKQSIVIDDDAICCSYQRINETLLKMEFSNERHPEYNDVETIINCNEETCIHNKECMCKALEVKIDSDAWCSTYRRK